MLQCYLKQGEHKALCRSPEPLELLDKNAKLQKCCTEWNSLSGFGRGSYIRKVVFRWAENDNNRFGFCLWTFFPVSHACFLFRCHSLNILVNLFFAELLCHLARPCYEIHECVYDFPLKYWLAPKQKKPQTLQRSSGCFPFTCPIELPNWQCVHYLLPHASFSQVTLKLHNHLFLSTAVCQYFKEENVSLYKYSREKRYLSLHCTAPVYCI